MATEEEVRAIWRAADCVCFDVDSTVCTDEGLDELAHFLNVGDKVAQLTNSAMSGGMTFKESLQKRLDIVQPSQDDIRRFLASHPPQLTEGLREVVDILHSRKVPVYLISGGFTSIIETVAEELKIRKANIRANKMLFFHNGEFAGFDHSQLTCATGGKPKVIEQLKSEFGYKRLVHIGDGVTDMEACPPADAFIGFGGNQVREKVKSGSKWFVYKFADMKEELQKNKGQAIHV